MAKTTEEERAHPVRYALTTIDNPFSPFTNWDEWYAYDTAMGYDSSALLARITNTSEELSEPDQDLAIAQGIDDVVEMNDNGLYKKISEEDVIKPIEG